MHTEYEPVFEVEFTGPGPRNTVLADCMPPLEQPRDQQGRLRDITYPCIPLPFDVPWLYRFGLYRITSYYTEVVRTQAVSRCVNDCGVEYLYRHDEKVELLTRRVIETRYGLGTEEERVQ
jgi:hypothetical protein